MPSSLSVPASAYLIAGGVVLLAPAWLFHRLRARRFARLNAVGIEVFQSYNHMMLVRSGEGVMRLLASLCVLGGCLLVGVGIFKLI